MRISSQKVALIILFFFASIFASHAQVDTGTLSGVVSDATGAVLKTAIVTVTNIGTNAVHTATTAANGTYSIGNLAPARYKVSINAPSFETYETQTQITVGGHTSLDAKLTVGSGITTIEVSATGGVQVNTDSQEISEVISPEQISQLPSLTRNIYDFVALSGNISSGDRTSQGQDQNSSSRGVGFSINGQRSSGTEILLDGVENSEIFGAGIGIHVPVDSVSEYSVLTSNYEPQYGRASGGVVNVVTARGANSFHGTASEFNRVAAYTANTVTNARQGLSKGGYTRNQPGFFISGPIVRDRLFFAASSEWLRVRSSAIESNYVPTPQLLAYAAPTTQAFIKQYGQTLNFASTVSNAEAGTPFPSVPSTTPVFGLVNYSVPQDSGGGLPQNTYNFTLRGDYTLTDKTQLFARYVGYHLDEPFGAASFTPYSEYDIGARDSDFAVLGGATHTFTPSLITSGRVSFSRLNIANTSLPAAVTTPALYLSSSAQVNGYNVDLPGNGYGLPFGGPQNVTQWNQDVNWTKGTHSLKFGGQILYLQLNRAFGAYAQAEESLAGSTSGDSTGYAGLISGTLGTFSTAIDPQGKFPGETITTPAVQPNFARSDRYHDWAVYAQDSWRVSPRLTLNYGVRYEFFGVQHNNHANLDSNFYYGTGSNDFAQIRSGQVFISPKSPIGKLWNPTYGAVGPRVGFAYDLTGNGRTSIRAGYGISYERNFGNVTFNVIQNPPNYAVIVLNQVPVTTSDLGTLGQSSGTVKLPRTSLRHVDQNIRTAQTQFWNAALEHELTRNTVIAADYVAARGIHLYDIKNSNGAGSGNYYAGDNFATAGYTRLNSQYSNINTRGSNGDSYYQALNLRLQTTNIAHSGLSATANYTWGHEIDDLSSTFSDSYAGAAGYNLGYTNPFNPAYDRGNGDLDIRQRFVIAPIYEAPWFKSQRGLTGHALGGWTATGIYTVRAGSPFTYFDSTNNDGTYYNIARYVPSAPIHKWKYNKSAGAVASNVNQFYLAQSLPVGQQIVNNDLGGYSNWIFPTNAPARNSFIGPGAWNVDLALSKKFSIHEKLNVELRAESFDVLNHHNLYVQTALTDAANYYPSAPAIYAKKGGVNGTASEERRFGQLALKVNF
ncbi:MAG: TonB-dependent receptor [Terracidiphilus sp.]|nr:TonB-dependent receptor [Terracidiphilus sp.]